MNRICLVIFILLASFTAVSAQASIATPAEQAKIKPLFESFKKAQEPWIAKSNALPESKAVADAQKVVEDAQAALKKAIEARDAVARKLPEFDPVKAAEAKLVGEIWQMMADHKLSSLEYRPTITEKGELAFVKTESQKPQPQ